MGTRAQAAATLAAVLVVTACSGSDGDGDPSAPVTTTDLAGNTVVVTPSPPATEAPDDEPTTQAPPVADATETTLPVPPDAAPTTAAPPQQEVLQRVSVEVPAGWSVQDMGEAQAAEPLPGEIPPHVWCLVPDYFVPEVDGCGGVSVAVGGDWLPGAAGAPYEPGQVDGWRSGVEPMPCPFDPEAEAGDGAGGDEDEAADEPDQGNIVVSDAEGTPLTSTRTEVAGTPMRYETWRVRCAETGEAFAPQLWHVPELNVLVRDPFGSPEAVAVLESLRGA